MLWRPHQRDTYTVYTTCEASDNLELQSCQVLSVFVNAETRLFQGNREVAEFAAAVWVFILDLIASPVGGLDPFSGTLDGGNLAPLLQRRFLTAPYPLFNIGVESLQKQICSNDGNLAPPQTEQLSMFKKGLQGFVVTSLKMLTM